MRARHQHALHVLSAILFTMACACYSHATKTSRTDIEAPEFIAEGPLVLTHADTDTTQYRFSLAINVKGQTLRIAADMGSNGSIFTDSAIGALHLPHWDAGATRIDTILKSPGSQPAYDTTANILIERGDTAFLYWGNFEATELDSFRLGRSLQDHFLVFDEKPAEHLAPFDGLFGRDLLSQFDLEFNLVERTLRLFSQSSDSTKASRWLPAGIKTSECAVAELRRGMTIDTSDFDSTDWADMRTNPAKRVFEQREMLVPIRLQGQSVLGGFDSGASPTILNWVAASALGIKRSDANVRRVAGMRMFNFSYSHADRPHDPAAPPPDTSNYEVDGALFEIAGKKLSPTQVIISDVSYADHPDYTTEPHFKIGLHALRNRVAFLSYSSKRFCVSAPVNLTKLREH